MGNETACRLVEVYQQFGCLPESELGHLTIKLQHCIREHVAPYADEINTNSQSDKREKTARLFVNNWETIVLDALRLMDRIADDGDVPIAKIEAAYRP